MAVTDTASDERVRLHDFRIELEKRIRGDVAFDEVTLAIYSTDASIYEKKPVAVVLPKDEKDVSSVVSTAVRYGINILPRGGGTSLGGQCVNDAVVIDFSKYMNQLLELNVHEGWVKVQPGIVLDVLNDRLAEHGLHFAPDPATSSRATIGGIIGNNASGTRSIVYGIARNHVLEVKTLLSDGEILDFGQLAGDASSLESHQTKLADSSSKGNGRFADILRGLGKIVDENRDEIDKRFPKVMRRVQGYNLDSFTKKGPWNLAELIVGSEGTLGVVLEAKLHLEPLPKHKILCIAHFTDRMKAIRTVAPILEHGPSAVEILDEDVITRARINRSTAPLCDFIEGDPKALLIVEFFGESAGECVEKTNSLIGNLREKGFGYAWPVLAELSEQAKVWAVRKKGLGLMTGMRGDAKPLAFIEDACVPVDVLPEYIDQILSFCTARGVSASMYAHASVGVIHVRPILNLKSSADITNLEAISEYSFELVTRYGGSWSGEHGDGRVRSPFLKRFFGDQVYNALKEVKKLFDPIGLLNPGSIIDANPQVQDLRFGIDYNSSSPQTHYRFRENGDVFCAQPPDEFSALRRAQL